MSDVNPPDLPLVSVIIPAFNAARFLRDTLLSVQSQIYRNIEIIIVDDGSTDSTAEIIENATHTDGRIRMVRHKRNKGVAEARNRGIAESHGELIAPIDADDVWDPKNISLQVEALRASGPRVGVCYAWFITIDGNDAFMGLGPESRLSGGRSVFRAQIRGNFIGNASSTVMRRKAVEQVGGYDPSLRARGAEGCEDQALYTLLAEKWDFTFVPRYLIAYRRHPGCMSWDGQRMARSQLLLLADLRESYRWLPNSWYGCGVADVFEGLLADALRRKDWQRSAAILADSKKRSLWAFARLVGFRVPIRFGQYAYRRLTRKKAAAKPGHVVDQFWSQRDSRSSTQLLTESLAAARSGSSRI